MSVFTKLAQSIFASVDENGNARAISPVEAQVWGTELERLVAALIAGLGDYELPELIYRYTVTGGTANAIVAMPSATPPTAPGAALLTMTATSANTGAVTLNGKPLRANGGEELQAGEVRAGDLLAFLDLGAEYRLITDPGSLRNKLAAMAWANNAEDEPVQVEAGGDGATTFSAKHWAAKSEESRNISAGHASDAVSQGNVPIYATAVGVAALNIPLGINAIRTNGYAAAGDGGNALYKRAATEPTHAAKINSLDGSWWELAEQVFDIRMIGGFGPDITDAIADGISASRALGGKKIFIPSGEYVFNGVSVTDSLFDIDIEGEDGKWPVLQPSQSTVDAGTLRLLRFEPSTSFELTGFSLAADIKPNQRTISLDSVASLEVGMLFQISSSKMWYHDDRGVYTCGELHVITSIDSVAKTISFQDQTRDSYSGATHTITLRAFRQNFFRAKNLRIKLPAPTGSTATVAIQTGQCFEPIMENIVIEGATNWGLQTIRCWKPLYRNISAYGLGRTDQNGYGISVKVTCPL
ncbi:hypothetical protein [Rhizobium halophilum]|uniref:hypothetical protein n=1 Tax=Rhizobium halophilum TaxID=2846852 RepID=UPI001EFCE150|nr:hypothetical protein [Rhizobium halophilum]MCF6371040.1 hypothetical protein [Rhizobium halophilum]